MTLLSGIIALALLVLFLGYYAVLIPFPPLVAIIATILLLAIADFVRSFREERRNHRPGATGTHRRTRTGHSRRLKTAHQDSEAAPSNRATSAGSAGK